jgi:2-haloacid dehalogenase
MAEGVAELVVTYPEHAELIRAWDRRFPDFWGGPIFGPVAVLTQLRGKRVPLYILTNWPAEKFPIARERFAFIEWFDGVLVSGEVGIIKPDPAIFELLSHRRTTCCRRACGRPHPRRSPLNEA